MKRGALLVLIAALATLVAYEGWRRWRPSEARYPIQGVDVSHHQGVIDWRALKSEGVDFAYIKATEGGDHRDRQFARNWRESAAAGVQRGAYHFFTLCRRGADQARNLLAALPQDPRALPVAIDLEFLGNCRRQLSRAELHRELAAFIGPVEARTGKPVLLYLTEEFDEAYQVSRGLDRPLWLRSLLRQPRFGAQPWTVWQVHSYRRARGVDGPIDWNVARPAFLTPPA